MHPALLLIRMPSVKNLGNAMTSGLSNIDSNQGEKERKEKKQKKAKKERKDKKHKGDHKDKDKDKDKEIKAKVKKEKKANKEKKAKRPIESRSESESEADVNISAKRARIESPTPTQTPQDTTPETGADFKSENKIPENLSFSSYQISPATVEALSRRGIKSLFPIQAEAFNPVYMGNDVLGRARTGTGKTLAFALPMVEVLLKEKIAKERGRAPRVLVLAPTRDLAIQVSNEFTSISPNLKTLCVYGGTPMREQTAYLQQGVDVVIGTPGRCMDHINRGNLMLHDLRFVCLDEADQMLDIGFADDMEQILQEIRAHKDTRGDIAPKHQTLLFSATAPEWIKRTVDKYLDPKYVNIDLVGNSRIKTNENIRHYAILATWQSRKGVIGDVLAVYGGNRGLTVIFTNTKAEADELAKTDKLKITAQVLHGDIPQAQRESTLQGFRDTKVKCIICTDVLARGIDIPMVDLVINCQPPKDMETYVHRSGRTGRAGRKGVCVTFYKSDEEFMIHDIERRAGIQMIKVGAPQPDDIIDATAKDAAGVIGSVVEEVIPRFAPVAETMLLETFKGNAVKALAAALAQIAGYGAGVQVRSLLSAAEGFTTLMFRLSHEIQNPGYVRNILSRNYPGLSSEDIKGIRMTKDMMGVVFDVTAAKIEVDAENTISMGGNKWTDLDHLKLEVVKTLPELEEVTETSRSSGGSKRGGRGGGRGGYKGRR
ncbi:Nucleolar RNA helicase 2 [Podila humilis]|nr:Nucleolar RNA helicase 2 [Podila humilis]